MFVGTFTAGGLEVAVQDGCLKHPQGRRHPQVRARRWSTAPSAAPWPLSQGQRVLYITERCVFRLSQEGLELIEIAPGVDLDRDILANMDFTPDIAPDLRLMPECIFRNEPMGLLWHAAQGMIRLPTSTVHSTSRRLP